MFEELRIRGLGVIEDAELPLACGLTVLTGETGAGKTMVVTALGLLLGGRPDPALVRSGAQRAVVEGRVRVDPHGDLARRSAEAGAEVDDDVLILGRTVGAEGRSRAWLGGRAVPAGLLGELGEELVVVHGQADQLRLLRPARQRAAVDAAAGALVAAPLGSYRIAYARLREVEASLLDLTGRARERAREADLSRFGLGEIEALDPQPGEDATLRAEAERRGHAEELRAAAAGARTALAGDEDAPIGLTDALGLVAAARRALEIAQDHDPELGPLAGRLGEAAYLLSDVAADLSSYMAGFADADPGRLAAVQERRAALAGLTRKYGATMEEVLAWGQEAASRLRELDGGDARIATLTAERAALRGRMGELAAQLGAARRSAGERLAEAVTVELAQLAMPHGRVELAVRRTPDPDGLLVDGEPVAFGPEGVEEVELLLSPHAGADPRPLGRGVSGGELSRVMLAVEVVLAGGGSWPTLVFDEVDAGVGGRAAVEVGRRLARLARDAQVLVVTHLPQVAAFADRHVRVAKDEDGSVTRSGVVVLDDTGRVRELSRMLAGLEGSQSALSHAEELLAAASRAKARRSRS